MENFGHAVLVKECQRRSISHGDVGQGVSARSVIVAYQSRHVGQGVVGQGVSAWCIDHGEWAKEYLHGVSAWCISYGDVGLGVGVVGQRVVVQGVSAWRVCVEY